MFLNISLKSCYPVKMYEVSLRNINLFMRNKPNLTLAKMTVTAVLTGVYEKMWLCEYGENKPKQTQFAHFYPKSARKLQKVGEGVKILIVFAVNPVFVSDVIIDNLFRTEKQRYLKFSRSRRIGTMNKIVTGRASEVPANSARPGIVTECPANHLASGLYNLFGFPEGYQDRGRAEIFDKAIIERFVFMYGVMCFCDLFGYLHKLCGDQLKALPLESRNNFTDKMSLYPVRLNDNQGSLCHCFSRNIQAFRLGAGRNDKYLHPPVFRSTFFAGFVFHGRSELAKTANT